MSKREAALIGLLVAVMLGSLALSFTCGRPALCVGLDGETCVRAK